jgi:hypothetical protein
LFVGGTGDDIFVYGSASGINVIDNSGGGTDWLFFQDGITSDRLTFIHNEDDLIVQVDGNPESQVTVSDWFLGGEMQLAYIKPDEKQLSPFLKSTASLFQLLQAAMIWRFHPKMNSIESVQEPLPPIWARQWLHLVCWNLQQRQQTMTTTASSFLAVMLLSVATGLNELTFQNS